MECRCGYKGLAEIGNFNGKRHGSIREEIHFRCPECKTLDFRWIHPIDSIREALIYPNGRSVTFISGGRDPNTIGYNITNEDGWDNASAISLDEFNALKEEFPQLDFGRATKDCTTELRRMGIDPNRLNNL